jgi:anion-transporting  ArsA/GET3 family ATPase
VAKKLLSLVTGQTLLDEILDFLAAFAELREGFQTRAEHVDTLLRGDDTAFVLVSSASPASTDDASWLRDDLQRRNVDIDAVVFNQSYRPLRHDDPAAVDNKVPVLDLEAVMARLEPHLVPGLRARDALVQLRALRAAAAEENRRYQRVVDGLAAELPPDCARVRAPRFPEEIRDLPGLMRLVHFLLR